MNAAPRISKPIRALTRRELEDLSDASFARGMPTPFYCQVIDHRRQPILPQFDLVVQACTPRAARHAWERWAEEQGAEGKLTLLITNTPAATGKRRPREERTLCNIDLDWLVLSDALDECDDADRALGL
ncbi:MULTISPECIES: hypothetical protein [Methylobacterium]|uniref:Protein of unassigned function n=2 Tax=Methylobacterium TaxID=407 RepID=A0A089NVV5_9HYPH|nr:MULTISPECIES: hypothetical protein [Methylobacterium]ACB24504.1 hypothetical protein Mrad2831_2510 [Methylobacterium radiotolerans JCM 2831]AIQ90675.1 protein of unassigned function [Methylobacterium oryzae CBMB20]MBE7200455.1 hypothetical protein [Parafilimonas terrae]GEN01336.1 hypothetical protein MRA01_58750 [Methylobacterium radiotolerans]